MKTVFQQSKFALYLLGQQTIDETKKYRPIRFLKTVTCEDGLLIFNILTAVLYIISSDEVSVFNGEVDPITHPVGRELISNWILVPEDTDDTALCMQLTQTALAFNRSRAGAPINSFTILPTTDCNARCFYCFEKGGTRKYMSEQTARDVAAFIDRKRKKDKVTLRWFGGEPLCNTDVIDIICQELKSKGVQYRSTMVSNGYLFDEETVKKASEIWQLTRVQITLDGTEEIYNRTKAYIYKDGSAFVRVMNNIELLLKEGIFVNVRMNMDDHNEKDLLVLAQMLIDRFGKYETFRMYDRRLFENSCAKTSERADCDRHALIDAQLRLRERIAELGYNHRSYLSKKSLRSHCMCDNDECTMILPDGQLGRCESFTDGPFYGSVYSDEIDLNIINDFKEVDVIDPNQCYGCELLPKCIALKNCKMVSRRCDENEKKFKTYELETKIINTYEGVKANNL